MPLEAPVIRKTGSSAGMGGTLERSWEATPPSQDHPIGPVCGASGTGYRGMRTRRLLELAGSWPVLQQLRGDPLALGKAAQSPQHERLRPRTADAEHVVGSICPFCAVGCGQKVYVKGGEIVQIEGDDASPISRGRLCPKGASTRSLVTGPAREYRVRYRPPYATAWQSLPLDQAMDMIADRVIATRAASW